MTGIVLAKLDGTAKGGVVIAIARELNLPIRYVGIGEKADDLLAVRCGKVHRVAVRKMNLAFLREALDLARQGQGADQSQSDGGRSAGARRRSGGPGIPHVSRH